MLKLTRILLGLIVLCSLVFILNFFKEDVLINDSEEYLNLAINTSEQALHYAGDLNKTVDYRLFSKRPIGYPLYISLSGFNLPILVIFTQCLLVLLLFFLGLEILKQQGHHNRRVFAIYSFFFISSLPIVFTAQFLMADLLLSVLLALIVYYTMVYFKEKSRRYLFRIGLLWMFALLCKPIVLPSVIIAFAIFIYLFIKKKELNWGLVMPLALALIVSLTNLQNTGYFHYSSISAINKLHYNSKLVIINETGLDSSLNTSQFNLAIPKDKEEFRNYIEIANSRSRSIVMNNKLAYLKIHLLGILKSLIDPGRFELYTFWGEDTRNLSLTEHIYSGNYQKVITHLKTGGLLIYFFFFLLLLSLIKVISAAIMFAKLRNKSVLFLMLIVAYFIGLAGPIGAFRFLLPAIIPYLVLASIGLNRGLEFLQKGSVR